MKNISKRILHEIKDMIYSIGWWVMFLLVCETGGFWWFDDGLRAANAFSGSDAYGPVTWWVFGFGCPSLLLYSLRKIGEMEVTRCN